MGDHHHGCILPIQMPLSCPHQLTPDRGNVQVDARHLSTPHDRTILSSSFSSYSDAAAVAAYSRLHTSILTSVPPSSPEPLTLIQISHAGLQSSSTINFSRAPWVRAVAPCSARPDTGDSVWGWLLGRFVWPVKSRTIRDLDEWLEIVDGFVRAASVAEEAGWGGVQIHSAHGYLLAEYLSPLVSAFSLSPQV